MKKYAGPVMISQAVLLAAWAASSASSGFAQAMGYLQAAGLYVSTAAFKALVYASQSIGSAASGGTRGQAGLRIPGTFGQGINPGVAPGGTGPIASPQPVYGAPIGPNPGFPPTGGGSIPPAQPVYGAPVGTSPGFPPGGTGSVPPAQPVYGAPVGPNPGFPPTGGGSIPPAQPVYGAPIGPNPGGSGISPQPGYGFDPGYSPAAGTGGQDSSLLGSFSTHLTAMLNPGHVSPEAVLSLVVSAVWMLITFWAVIGWAFWGICLYLKKRGALKERSLKE